jgi:hypothetical protein
MQCNAMQCNAMQCNAMQCNTLDQFLTMAYNTGGQQLISFSLEIGTKYWLTSVRELVFHTSLSRWHWNLVCIVWSSNPARHKVIRSQPMHPHIPTPSLDYRTHHGSQSHRQIIHPGTFKKYLRNLDPSHTCPD